MLRVRDLVSQVVADYGGAQPIEQGEGDSFVAAFDKTTDAVAVRVWLTNRFENNPAGTRV